MTIHVAKLVDSRGSWWVISAPDEKSMAGPINGTRKALVEQWIAKHGKPDKIVDYRESFRPSEFAMQMADQKLD
jgi:hypothetical protein